MNPEANFESSENQPELGPLNPDAESETRSPTNKPLSMGGVFAWITITVITLGMVVMTTVAQMMPPDEDAQSGSIALAGIQMQGKMLMAQTQLSGAGLMVPPEIIEEGSEEAEPAGMRVPANLDIGTYEQRLGYTILVNEFEGTEAAIKSLQLTDQRAEKANLKLSDDQQSLHDTLETLLARYRLGEKGTDDLATEDKQQLVQRMGWLGELALVPVGTPDDDQRAEVIQDSTRYSFLLVAGVVAFGFTLLIGFVAAIVLSVMLLTGRIQNRFCHSVGDHNFYVETFAIWMVIFFGGQIGTSLVLAGLGIANEMLLFVLMPIFFFGSLVALAWPVVRGLSFSQVRQDIGWKFGNPLVEAGTAAISYVAFLPLLVFGLIVFALVLFVFGGQPSPEVFAQNTPVSHPIVNYLAEGNLFVISMVMLMACVAAPIVEETMFRGVLYRHLRDWSTGWTWGASVSLGCFINSLVFAAIHPQGLAGIPLLMMLAVAFTLVREWRGSLWASMIMHGVNNAIVTLTTIVFLT